MEKPIFIPLRTEYYDAFFSGVKTDEFRRYGARWNEAVCRIGRAVTLSKGYGKKSRMSGRVANFTVRHGSQFNAGDQIAIKSIYGTIDIKIACISIRDLSSIKNKHYDDCTSYLICLTILKSF